MSLLQQMRQSADTTIKEEGDSVGFQVWDSDIYAMRVKEFFFTASDSGAIAVNLKVETTDSKEQTFQEYISTNTANGCKNTYTDSKGNNRPLKGFATMDSLCRLTLGHSLLELVTETRQAEAYSSAAGKRVLQPVEMAVDMIGQEFFGAILHVKESKNVKHPVSGDYVPSDEIREENAIDKIFNVDQLTLTEHDAGITEPTFYHTWIKKNKGQVRDNTKTAVITGAEAAKPQSGAGTGATNMGAAPAQRPATQAPTNSLFNKRA